MHYYQFHIGDYRAATAHLSNEEDLAYRRLLDMYYDTEQPIPADIQWVSRRIRVEASVIRDVLNDMFERAENGTHTHKRVDQEIAKYKALEARNKANGSKGGRPKNPDKPSGLPVESHTEPTGKATKNHKPRTNNQIEAPEGVTTQVWSDFLALRKAKKLPLTETALKGIADEGKKLNWDLAKTINHCCLSGWAGFKASWVMNDKSIGQPVRNGLAGAI